MGCMMPLSPDGTRRAHDISLKLTVCNASDMAPPSRCETCPQGRWQSSQQLDAEANALRDGMIASFIPRRIDESQDRVSA